MNASQNSNYTIKFNILTEFLGAPERIRTSGLCLRRETDCCNLFSFFQYLETSVLHRLYHPCTKRHPNFCINVCPSPSSSNRRLVHSLPNRIFLSKPVPTGGVWGQQWNVSLTTSCSPAFAGTIFACISKNAQVFLGSRPPSRNTWRYFQDIRDQLQNSRNFAITRPLAPGTIRIPSCIFAKWVSGRIVTA